LETYPKRGGFLQKLIFSPNGQNFLASNTDASRIFSLTGSILAEIKGASRKADFSPDGTKLILGTNLWKLTNPPQKIAEYKGQENSLSAVKFSTDGTNILMASGNNHQATRLVVLWDGKDTVQFEDENYFYLTTAAAFSRDGTKIITGSNDGLVRLWDRKGALRNKFEIGTTDLGGREGITAIAFSPDESEIIAALQYGYIKRWTKEGKLIEEYNLKTGSDILCFIFSPDGNHVYNVTNSSIFQAWNIVKTMEGLFASDQLQKLTSEQKKQFGIQ
jgi:WD40 repeat protein